MSSPLTSEAQEFVIALFDVLGFGERVQRFPLEEIYAQYRELISIASSKVSHAFLDAWPAGDGTSVPFLGSIHIEHHYFSDTILLWTHLRARTFNSFLHVCSRLICEALEAALPLRGAISVGTAIMNKATGEFLGPPLVELARAEKAQQWIGLTFGRSFTSRKDVPFRADLVRPYNNHLKPGFSDVVAELVIDWPRVWHNTRKTSPIPFLERLSVESKVPEYYRCTIDFVRHSDDNPSWYRPYQVER